MNKEKKVTMMQTFLKELQENGFTGLYTGMKAKIVQSVFNSAIMLMIYERTVLLITSALANKANWTK